MFALFEKLFRAKRVAAQPLAPTRPTAYSVVAPVWRVDGRTCVYRGLGSDPIAIVKNLDQAQTLCDTLNLADGKKPSRRLLDAIYLEEATTLTSN